MSTVIMSACWPLQGMSATQKAVLISLADNANDEGVCWPSVSNICLRTCLSERAVQGAIRWLVLSGVLSVSERNGRSTLYTVTPEAYAPPQEMHPRTKGTPASGAPQPPQEMHHTPANPAPHPRSSCTQNRNRTNTEPSVEPQSSLPALPDQPGQVVPLKPAKRKPRAAGTEVEQARQEACREIWKAYAAAYEGRYRTLPIRNAKVNSQVNDLLKRLGAESAAVAAYFVSINDAYLIRNCHDFGSLLAKAEAYRTQWATNMQVNGRTARQIEDTQANLNAAQEAARNIREGGKTNAFL